MPFEFCISFSYSLNKDLTERNRKLEGEIMVIHIIFVLLHLQIAWNFCEPKIKFPYLTVLTFYLWNILITWRIAKNGGVHHSEEIVILNDTYTYNHKCFECSFLYIFACNASTCTCIHVVFLHLFVMPSNMNLNERCIS